MDLMHLKGRAETDFTKSAADKRQYGSPLHQMLLGIGEAVLNSFSSEITPEEAARIDAAKREHGAHPLEALFKGKGPKK